MTRSDHRYAKPRLERFIDDELPGTQVSRVALHLPDCPDCSAEVRFLLRIRAALQEISPTAEAPPSAYPRST